VRRLCTHLDACPDKLTIDQLEQYFADLVESHSWSTVKIDRNGLQFSWKHVLKKDWHWLDIIKAPKCQSLPDILTPQKVAQLIGTEHKLRYVLPKGLRRVRNYGFLHGNAKRLLHLVQMTLKVALDSLKPKARHALRCPRCNAVMQFVQVFRPGWLSG
jgi:hypothetical protein